MNTFLDRFRFLKNFYLAATLGLLVWMLFFDLNDIPSQVRNAIKLRQLESEKAYYQEQIKALKKEQQANLGDDKRTEKYAREKYFMKKPAEDVFVLVDENGEPIEK